MVIWSLQVAIRGTVSLTAYKTQLKVPELHRGMLLPALLIRMNGF